MPGAIERLLDLTRRLLEQPAAAAFVAACVTALLLTPPLQRLVRRIGLSDAPGGRHLHAQPVPRLGGVAIFAGLLVGLWVAGLGPGDGSRHGPLLLAAALVFLVGAVDDVRGLGPAPRVFAEVIAASLLVQSGYLIDVIATPWTEPLHLGVLAVPITIAWFVGVTNAFNLIDGLDGLMSSIGLAALLGCALVADSFGVAGTGTVALALAGALVGFLRWNWAPAQIFPGDSGSLLVGFVVAALAIDGARTDAGVMHVHVPLLICAVPLIETALTLARRYAAGQPYFSGDQSHIHHVLLKSGLSVRRAVLLLWSSSLVLAAIGVLSKSWRSAESLIAMALLLCTVVIALAHVGYVEVRVAWQRFQRRVLVRPRRSLASVVALARAGESVRQSRSVSEFRDRLRAAVVESGLTYLALEFTPVALTALDHASPVQECRSPAATRFFRQPASGVRWIFSTEPTPSSDGLSENVTVQVTIPLPADGRYGSLICEAQHSRVAESTPIEAIEQYLAVPVAETLRALETVVQERKRAREAGLEIGSVSLRAVAGSQKRAEPDAA